VVSRTPDKKGKEDSAVTATSKLTKERKLDKSHHKKL